MGRKGKIRKGREKKGREGNGRGLPRVPPVLNLPLHHCIPASNKNDF